MAFPIAIATSALMQALTSKKSGYAPYQFTPAKKKEEDETPFFADGGKYLGGSNSQAPAFAPVSVPTDSGSGYASGAYDAENSIDDAVRDVTGQPLVRSKDPAIAKSNDTEDNEGYGDTSAWVGAAVNLLSDLERERQAKAMNLQNQASMSANYGLNAMGAAGSALDRLNRGRMGGMGLSSMAGR